MNRLCKKTAAVLIAVTLAVGMLPLNIAAEARTLETDFDFNEKLMPIYLSFFGPGLDFFNVDFGEFDIEESPRIIRVAEWFLDVGYDDGKSFMDAGELGIFFMEAFGIELPLKTLDAREYDIYTFDEDAGVFIYAAANGGWGPLRWVTGEYTENEDGSITVIADLYTHGLTLGSRAEYEAEFAKPPELWSMNRGRNARSEITLILHEDYEFFPMQLVSIQTEWHDWREAEGTYKSEDGAFILSFGLDDEYRYDGPSYYHGGRLNVVVTDTLQERDFLIHALINHNTAEFHTEIYNSLESFMTLLPDGTIFVSALADFFDVDFTGTFTRISDEVPPLRAMFGYEWEWLRSDGNRFGGYMLPIIGRMGGIYFDYFVQRYISDTIVWAFEEFYGQLDEIGENTRFDSRLSIVALSEFYYALAVFTETYVHGAAHGNYSIRIFNIDAEREILLTIDDVFVDGYRPILEGILNEMAASDEFKERLFPDAEITLTENTQFFITDTEAVIIFQTYEIAPFASGIIRFNVPVSEIEDLLREEYMQRGPTRQISDNDLFRGF